MGSIWVCSDIAGIQKTLVLQQLCVEQFGIERRTAGGAVGGAGAVGGSQRQQLPGRHATAPQQLDPGEGAGSKATAGAGPRQGGGMQQHSATAFVTHSCYSLRWQPIAADDFFSEGGDLRLCLFRMVAPQPEGIAGEVGIDRKAAIFKPLGPEALHEKAQQLR